MGADGHIRIMDAEKLIADKGLSEERFQQFMSVISGSLTYLQKLGNRRYVSDYWGDNIWLVSNLNTFIEGGFHSDLWSDSNIKFFNEKIVGFNFTQDEFSELAKHLWNDCYVAEWEVWT